MQLGGQGVVGAEGGRGGLEEGGGLVRGEGLVSRICSIAGIRSPAVSVPIRSQCPDPQSVSYPT